MKTQSRRRPRGWIAAVLACAALIAAGCGGQAPEAGDPDSTAPGPPLDDSPTRPSGATPTAPAGEVSADQYGLPYDLTGYELLASRAGEAVYSGYRCAITPIGCACETPVIERASFAFTNDGHLDYRFSGDGYEATWRMTRIGPNNWDLTRGERDESGIRYAHFVILTFIDSGFIVTEGADLGEGTIVACPDVTFRRLAAPTPEP
jgi:hypothetical protein